MMVMVMMMMMIGILLENKHVLLFVFLSYDRKIL